MENNSILNDELKGKLKSGCTGVAICYFVFMPIYAFFLWFIGVPYFLTGIAIAKASSGFSQMGIGIGMIFVAVLFGTLLIMSLFKGIQYLSYKKMIDENEVIFVNKFKDYNFPGNLLLAILFQLLWIVPICLVKANIADRIKKVEKDIEEKKKEQRLEKVKQMQDEYKMELQRKSQESVNI